MSLPHCPLCCSDMVLRSRPSEPPLRSMDAFVVCVSPECGLEVTLGLHREATIGAGAALAEMAAKARAWDAVEAEVDGGRGRHVDCVDRYGLLAEERKRGGLT